MYISELPFLFLKTDKNEKTIAFDIPFRKGNDDPLYSSLSWEI
jgi:hypothetical protein